MNAYVAPTALLAGTLTVGPTAARLVIAAGTKVSSQVEVGANLCFDLEIDTAGRVHYDTTVTANTTTSVDICGLVNAFAAADADSYGSLRIGGVDFVLAAGSQLPAAVRAGANLCLDLTLNAFGQGGGTARANATVTVRVCGRVTAFAAASATSTGNLTIGARSFVLGLGSHLPSSVRTGANLCTALTIDGLAQVSGERPRPTSPARSMCVAR